MHFSARRNLEQVLGLELRSLAPFRIVVSLVVLADLGSLRQTTMTEHKAIEEGLSVDPQF